MRTRSRRATPAAYGPAPAAPTPRGGPSATRGYGPSGWRARRRTDPSGRSSTVGVKSPSVTARHGGVIVFTLQSAGPHASTFRDAIDVGRLLDDGHWRARQKLFVFLTALTIVFDGIDNQLLGIAVPAMMRDWSLPRSTFAPVIASSMVGMMIGGAVAGIVGDRFGRRVALIGSVLIFGVLTAAVAFVDGPWALAALRFLAGLGLGGAMPNAAALASEYVPRRHRPFAITLTIVCVPLGGTLAAFAGGHLMPVLGWRALFGLGGLVSVGVAGILVWALPESPRFLARYPERWPELTRILNAIGHDVPPGSSFVDRTEQAIATSSVRTLFTPAFARDTAALWGAMFACMLSVYTAFNWVPTMLTDAKLPIAVASNGLAAFNLGGVAGAISAASSSRASARARPCSRSRPSPSPAR